MPDSSLRIWGHSNGPILNHCTIFELHTFGEVTKILCFQWPHGIKSLLHMLLGMNNKHVSLVSPAKANSLPLAPPGKPK